MGNTWAPAETAPVGVSLHLTWHWNRDTWFLNLVLFLSQRGGPPGSQREGSASHPTTQLSWSLSTIANPSPPPSSPATHHHSLPRPPSPTHTHHHPLDHHHPPTPTSTQASVTNQVPGLPQSTEIDRRPDKKFRRGSYWGPCCRSGGARTAVPCSLSVPWWSGGVVGEAQPIPYMA